MCAGFEIEVPPLGGQDVKTAGRHGLAQDVTQTDVLGAEDAAAHELHFVANMGGGTEIVDGRSHGKTGGVAGCVEQTTGSISDIMRPTKGEVNGQSIVVQSASARRIADVDAFGSARDGVPHALLNAHGAGGIVDFESVIGIFALQGYLGTVQSVGGFGQQIGAAQIGVEHTPDEIIGTGIHQTDENTGNGHTHIDQTALFQRTLERGASLGGRLTEERQRKKEEGEKKTHIHRRQSYVFLGDAESSHRKLVIFAPMLKLPCFSFPTFCSAPRWIGRGCVLSAWVLGATLVLQAQTNETDSMKSTFFRPTTVEGGLFAGSVLTMDRYQRAWMEGTSSRGLHLGLRRRTLSAPDGYAADYNYPEWSVNLQLTDYSGVKMRKRPSPDWGQAVPVDYSSSPGQVIALAVSFSRPLWRRGNWQMGYALEEGLAFCTRPYAKADNIDNELTGGHWLIHFGASLYGAKRLDRHWSVRGDLAFRHVSNGATYRPNKGLNAVLPTLTVQYDLDEIADFPSSATKTPFARRWFWRAGASMGMRTLIEDWISTQYGTAPSEADYRTEHFLRYAVANVQLDGMFRYARRWATGVGADLFYMPYVQTLKKREAPNGSSDRYSEWACGLALKHEAYYGAFSAYVHLGWYLHRRTGRMQTFDETPYYERVGARWHLPMLKGASVHLGIKAHRLKADFTELGFGFEW